MAQKPTWLPPKLTIKGKTESFIPHLYKVFRADFIDGKPMFRDMPVWWNRRKVSGQQYEQGFWHLVSEEPKTGVKRTLDIHRAEKLPWCKPTITHSDDKAVTVWEYLERGRRSRTYIWLREWDYCIVVERRQQRVGNVAMLITAFHVNGSSRRKALSRKLAARED